MINYAQRDKLVFKISCILILLIASFSVITFLTGRSSFSDNTLEKWDGVSIASSFSAGNGTKENPYLIQSGAELAYFKQVIETSSIYADKYYALNQNINLNQHEWIPIGKEDASGLHIFQGHFDGRGYSVQNAVITTPSLIDGVNVYGLFSIVQNVTIENLNVEGMVIRPTLNDTSSMIGVLAGKSQVSTDSTLEKLAVLSNLSITNSQLDLTNITENKASKIGGFVGEISDKTEIQNIYLGVQIHSPYVTSIGKIAHTVKSNTNRIMVEVQTDSFLLGGLSDYISFDDTLTFLNSYTAMKENEVLKITKENQVIAVSDLILELHDSLNEKYYWYQEGNVLKIGRVSSDVNHTKEEEEVVRTFAFGKNAPIPLHDSGVSGDTIYINNLTSDYNYYKGLNYTDMRSVGTLPTGDNLNFFTDQNLVKVYTHYHGTSYTDASKVGYVSLEEQQSDFIYYQYYPVENGYVTFELIDHPYADRPDNQAFNGWITNYPGASITLDNEVYVRTVKIPVSEVSDTISIDLYANWIDATTYEINSNNMSWSTVYNNLKSAGMQEATLDNQPVYKKVDMRNYYVDETISYRQYYPTGSYVSNGTSVTEVSGDQCFTWSGCNYKTKSSSATYDPDITYYQIVNLGGSYFTDFEKFVPEILGYGTPIYEDINMTNYYVVGGTISYNRTFPLGAYFANGVSVSDVSGSQCTNSQGCEYKIKAPSASYNPDITYYQIVNLGGSYFTDFEEFIPPIIEYKSPSPAGFFKKITVPRYSSYVGYYDSLGNYQASGTCSTTSGCTYYEYVQYYDEKGNPSVIDTNAQYYYLVTRDTNIVVLQNNNSASLLNTKPMTLTSVNNGTDYRSSATYTISSSYIKASQDLRVEYIKLNSNKSRGYTDPTSSTGSSSYIYGNWNNLKIGRGLQNVSSYRNAYAVIGGGNNSTGSSSSLKKYRIIVESGLYNSASATNGTSSGTMYVDGQITYGSDYDRIISNNSSLDIYYCASGSWGGNLYSSSTQTGIAITTIVKSGSFGSSEYDYSTGIYVGGRSGGNHYAAREAVIEGGWIYNLIGGPLTASNRRNINDTYLNIKGGSIDMVIGGAGASATYGNRIINFTGGTVNYSVFGGSNAYIGSDSGSYLGTLEGSTFLYVGGTATVGNNKYNDTLFGVESGSVFGIGNGNSTSSKVGTADNSNIIIDGDATIRKNVYGGGNYGSTGISSNRNTTSTNISVLGGDILGSVYGGGNNNGSGTTSVTSDIQVKMLGGIIEGSLYGGSKTKGVVYGNTNVHVLDGTVYQDVYGGGEGGYLNTSNPGTYVTKDVNVMIGSTTEAIRPIIKGSLYGGSAYGTVNGNTNNGTATGNTSITIQNALINGSVYGGAKGNRDYTPYVLGNTVATIYDGNIGTVYGGNDQAGVLKGNSEVYIHNGVIGTVYGGGNNTGQDNSNVIMDGGIVDKIFGGSNSSGTVKNANVSFESGMVTNIYGGNNIGGLTERTNLSLTGGYIAADVYGGGRLAETNSSKIVSKSLKLRDMYGGGEQAGVQETDILIQGTNVHSVYGGSNISGDVVNTKVTIESGTIEDVYGGNNEGGSVSATNVNILNGTFTNVYGGGNRARASQSNLTIMGGKIIYAYGGGNQAGLTTSNLNILGGTISSVYGGSNYSGNVTTSNIDVTDKKMEYENPYVNLDVKINATDAQSWQSTEYATYIEAEVTLSNKTARDIEDWQFRLDMPTDTIVYSNWSSSNISINQGISIINSDNPYYGKNTLYANGGSYTLRFQLLTNTPKEKVNISSVVLEPSDQYIPPSITPPQIEEIYGGNNQGGLTSKTNVSISTGQVNTVYGGGNQAVVDSTNVSIRDVKIDTVYGGGNAAGVQTNTFLDINNSQISTNIYGGGNEGTVAGNTNVFVTGGTILGSAYAGGNGSTAIVSGNTSITVDGGTVVGSTESKAPSSGCVFGGGNAAATGNLTNNASIATVNLVGAHVYGNIYGGANTSVVYGKTDTNIGTDAVSASDLAEDNIIIQGTVFGGGEANASGSEVYDYSFISVTGAIDIQINGKGYLDRAHSFQIAGSIFGSGNASSSSGTSDIVISHLGTKEAPSQNISIQRADTVTVDQSVIELEGTTDRTNEYSTIKYSFNRINQLTIKNNSTLLLKQNANLLKELVSAVDIQGKQEKAIVSIDDETKTVTKNVDNRIYLVPNRNLNITTNEAATSYGKISGMTFFGMYNSYAASDSFSYGVYDSSVSYGDSADAGDVIIGGSYVLGLHSLDHDIQVDGFYSNYLNDDYTEVRTAYIEPTPPDSNYYMWTIGMQSINYSFTLNASKYSSLGTYELSMLDFSKGDTIFNVIGFNSEGLGKGVSLVDSTLVPKVTNTAEEANKVLGLSMKTETREWTSYGTTKLLGENGGKYTGTTNYKTDSQMVAPSMMFYLYHAKNITLNGDLGTVVVSLQALTPINEIDYEVHLITITIDITARNYDDGDAYDASITYDKKYEMPSATSVNITNQSQFTAYYSLFAYAEQLEDFYGRGNTNYHVLTTSYALPVGTQVTMLDYGVSQESPQYYYYTVSEESYQKALLQLQTDNEATYRLSDFVKMGSTSPSNTYDDTVSNQKYYSKTYGRTIEEFLFIFDFKDTTTTGIHQNNSILFELRNTEDRSLVSVLGIRQNLMNYNLYDTSNVVLNETVTPSSNYMYYDIPSAIDYTTLVAYDQTENRESIINTNYESSSMGLNVSILDSSSNQVSSSLLSGTSIKMNGVSYFVDSDGTYRIKLAGKVSNLNKTIYLTPDELLPAGTYTLRFVLFASPDGLHNSHALESAVVDIPVTIVGNNNSITIHSDDKTKVVDGDTGKNVLGVPYNKYIVSYQSVLANPNVRVSLYKRNIDTKETTEYQEIPFNSLFGNVLLAPSYLSYIGSSDYERMLSVTAGKENTLYFNFNSSLTSGTYRLVFKLYDYNQLIEEENKYIIVKKKIE